MSGRYSFPPRCSFFGAGMLFPAGDQRRDGAVPFLAGTAGALVGGLQNIGSGVLASLCDVAANRSGQPGVVDDLNGIVDRCIAGCRWRRGCRIRGSPFKRTSPQHRHQLHGRTMLLYQITHHPHMRCGVRIKRLIARTKHAVWRLLASVRARRCQSHAWQSRRGCGFSLPPFL